jgi:hypothetical protein
MNRRTSSNYYVADVQSHQVLIRSFGGDVPKWSAPLHARLAASDPTLWIIMAETQTDLVSVLTALKDSGVPFLDVPASWPPAAVFEQMREEGKLSGTFTAVTFAGESLPRFQTDR